jgi:hypothetical protein
MVRLKLGWGYFDYQDLTRQDVEEDSTGKAECNVIPETLNAVPYPAFTKLFLESL